MKQTPLRVILLMPVRDDWVSAAELILRLDRTISPKTCTLEVFMVDDGSLQKCDPGLFQKQLSVVQSIRTIRLRRNLGHQRAIAIGLAHIQKSCTCDAVIVMDADGEDTPEGVAQLLAAYGDSLIVQAIFAERNRRSESLLFQIFYRLYKILHVSLTGISVRVGNFSILPQSYINTLVVMSELWNHYSAAVFRSKLPFQMIPIPRGKRIAGVSRMNFVALVSHGLSAVSVFGDIVGVRLLIASLTGSLLAGLGMIAVGAIRLFTNQAIPGWATYATGTLAIIGMQMITIATSFTFFMLSSRTNLGFVPARDYPLFLGEIEDIYV